MRLLVFQTALLALAILLAPHPGMATGEVAWGSLEPAHVVSFRSGVTPTDHFGMPHDQIQGYLRKPDGPGPFPVVVLLPGSMRIFQSQRRWAEELARWGYVALLVNSNGRDSEPSVITRAQDAYGALGYLQLQSYADSRRAVVIGWEMGGTAVMAALRAAAPSRLEPQAEFVGSTALRFRAGVAFYPRCIGTPAAEYAPLLILMGADDRYFGPEQCQALGRGDFAGGRPVRVHLYPGATHLFDKGVNEKDGFGNPMTYDPAATQDAAERIRALLAETLR